MKNFAVILFSVFLLSAAQPGNNDQLKQNFLHPGLDFRMRQNQHAIPSDPKQQDSLIIRYLRNGYGGFATNVDFNDYLTEEGMKSFKSFCDKAKQQGMSLWLYDERGYPSGNAGDLVINTNPEWEGQGLFCRDTLVSNGPVLFKLPPGKIILAKAIPEQNGNLMFGQAVDIQQETDQGNLNWTAPAGKWKILIISKYHLYEKFQAEAKGGGKMGAHYPSLMIPEVTKRFIELTHDAYANVLGNNLGNYFISTFTDEPSLMAVSYGHFGWGVIPWAQVLSGRIRQKYGYLPEDHLMQLFLDDSSTGQRLRYHYFYTMGELFAANFFTPIKEWCRKHHFLSGGHLLLEETMMAHVPLYGDAFRCLREMDAPGIDVLSCFPSLTPVHAPKLASGAAELSGASRVMCEPCPVADRNMLKGKETPAEHVRGFLNIQLLGGITDFNNYLQLSNSDQKEKQEFNEYVARIAMLMRGGHTRSDIAVLYPVESLWTRWIPRSVSVAGWDSVSGGHPAAIQVEQSFRKTCEMLYRNRWEYSIIDSKAIADARVKNGKLIHQQLQWKAIILPSVNTLSLAACRRLRNFVGQGGLVIAIDELPVNSEFNFPDPEVIGLSEEMASSGKRTNVLKSWNEAKINTILTENLVRPIRLEDEKLPVRYAHRMIEGHDCYFVINDSDAPVQTTMRFFQGKNLEEWDPANGTVKPVDVEVQLALKPFHGKVYRSR